MAPKPIAIDKINQGGLAHSLYSGAKNSLYKLTGFDIHSEPGALLVRQKLALDTGSIVSEFCKARVNCSNGEQYWFSSTSGKIWRRTSGGTWELAYTTDLTFATRTTVGFLDAGTPYTKDAYEFAGYIYWVTEKQVHRIPVASATGTWSSYVTLGYAALNVDNDTNVAYANTYTLPTSLAEAAANMRSITFETDTIESIFVRVASKGTGDWTLTLHDAANTAIGAVTVTNANVNSASVLFKFASAVKVTPGYAYHYHIHVSTGTSTVATLTASTLAGSNYVAYTTSDPDYHPMREQNGVLYIGDKHFLHQIEDTRDTGSAGIYGYMAGSHLFTARAFDVPQPHRIKCIGKVDTDILVGTIISNNVTKCAVFRWNTWSVSFTSQDEIEESGINAFLEGDNVVLVNAGLAGNIYVYDGAKLQLYKRVPGTFSKTQYGSICPNSVGNLGGLILFGFSNGSGNPADQGVYVMGRYSIDYPLVLDFSFPISERDGSDDLITSNLEIGAILVNGFDLYVAWERLMTVTMTIASPCVVTATAHSFSDGEPAVFTTTGALPTGVTAGTTYYVKPIDANTFHLYDTSAHAQAGGATGRVDTSGSQSGVHTTTHAGVDKIDYDNKLEHAYYETRLVVVQRDKVSTFPKIDIGYRQLPTNTSITQYYSKDHGAYIALASKVDSIHKIVVADTRIEASVLQYKIEVGVSANNAPILESAAIYVD